MKRKEDEGNGGMVARGEEKSGGARQGEAATRVLSGGCRGIVTGHHGA